MLTKLADLGSCMATNPHHRIKFDEQRLRATGVPVTTLQYRAPELLFGMQDFTAKVVCFLMFFCREVRPPQAQEKVDRQGKGFADNILLRSTVAIGLFAFI